LIKVQDRINDGGLFVTDLIKLFQYDEIDFDRESCEQCGHTTSTTTWEI
jgi:hypothetical protein